MEHYEEKEIDDISSKIDIAEEISKLTEEVNELQNNIKNAKKKEKSEKMKRSAKSSSFEFNPAIEYVSELLQNSSESIISEMKSEFFRLFNFLSSMFSVSPYQLDRKSVSTRESQVTEEDAEIDAVTALEREKEREMVNLLLDERESLIYELSDQIVAIEAEKKLMEEEMKKIVSDKVKWEKQKSILERIVSTDPRFNIINLLRRMGVIAPIQLSFVLGVSLSQTQRYIIELERMKILIVNEDNTISLHHEFDEETMNIKITDEK